MCCYATDSKWDRALDYKKRYGNFHGSCTLWTKRNEEVPHFAKESLQRHIVGQDGEKILMYWVMCWPLVPEFAGSTPAEAVGFLRAKKILSTPSFGGEVKPSVPCRRFAACKRSLNGVQVVISAKLTGQHSRPQFPLPPLGSLTSWRTWRHLVVKSGNI